MIQEVIIEQSGVQLEGHLTTDKHPRAWVIFAHGSGSSRKSGRNNWMANELNSEGYATLLFDLLTQEEDENYSNRFNINLLAQRLKGATEWLLKSTWYQGEPVIYYGASTGAAAALVAAATAPASWPLMAIISRGGRPDIAEKTNLNSVFLPVLLIVGDLDSEVLVLNEWALQELPNAELTLVEGATHLFEEPGKLATVSVIVKGWLKKQLSKDAWIGS